MTQYIALIHKDADSDFSVSFPDLPGCVTAGTTLDEARVFAAEALALHLDGIAEDGEAIPAPSSLDAIMQDACNRDAVAFLVPAPVLAEKTVRVNITLSQSVLDEIDRAADLHGMTRSGFLVRAARKAMAA